jgi:formate-dependent nitrite reductase membrane component NrfD
MMKPPVWTWEVPLYFWFGGMASGSAFVSLACDLAGDERSARVARGVALAALMPSPPLLIMDLGRPERFYNMLRIFKPRSPMSTGAWCLTVFGGLSAASVGADLLRWRRTAKVLGGANAVVGGYLGSYTGVLLAATAVPVWARSRLFLGPIFVATATLTGAATTRLALVASGMPAGHPTRVALGRVESGAMTAELLLSAVNEHRLGRLGKVLEEGKGRQALPQREVARARRHGPAPGPPRGRALGPPRRQPALHGRRALLPLRLGRAGPASARDNEAVARMARARGTAGEPDPPARRRRAAPLAPRKETHGVQDTPRDRGRRHGGRREEGEDLRGQARRRRLPRRRLHRVRRPPGHRRVGGHEPRDLRRA